MVFLRSHPDQYEIMEQYGLLHWPRVCFNARGQGHLKIAAKTLEDAIGKINRRLADEDMHGESLAHHLAVGPSYFIKIGQNIDYNNHILQKRNIYVQDVIKDIKGVWYNSVYPYLLATFHGERTNPVKLTKQFCKYIDDGDFKNHLESAKRTVAGAQEEEVTGDGAGSGQTITDDTHGEGAPVDDSDIKVLREWRDKCPNLKRTWKENHYTMEDLERYWSGVTMEDTTDGRRVVKLDLKNKKNRHRLAGGY